MDGGIYRLFVTSTWHIAGLVLEADWVEAWATAAGAVGAVGAFTWQARALAHERKTRREEVRRLAQDQKDMLSAQARLVVLDDPHVSAGEIRVPVTNNVIEYGTYQVVIRNFGELPVYNLHSSIVYIPEDESVMHKGKGAVWLKILPGKGESIISFDIKENFPDVKLPEGTSWKDLGRRFLIDVTFVDVHGMNWRITEDNSVRPATE
ncbi:hypothetical protein [Actinoplanes sp. NPDC049599]|uniref:hypothetical protein n=1 Tax=Actinoplanes sp. NPDC049599 TaxID=3363903 RepID=UPI0037B628C3